MKMPITQETLLTLFDYKDGFLYYKPGICHGSIREDRFAGFLRRIKDKKPQLPLLITERRLSIIRNLHT